MRALPDVFTTAAVTSLALLGAACATDADDEGEDAGGVWVSLSNVGPGRDGHAGATVTIVDGDGAPLNAGPGNTRVTVHTRGGGAWQPATGVDVAFGSPPRLDVMMVADNSGSARAELDSVQDALHQIGHVLLAPGRHRVGLVRVSTASTVVQPLSASEADLAGAIDGLFVTNGWTALWDGVRHANDALEAGRVTVENGTACFAGGVPAIVAFTDGYDNNSADERAAPEVGDGVDTSLDDLLALDAGGVATVVHTVAISDDADHASLAVLADASGGRATRIGSHGQLIGALHAAAAQLDALIPLCFAPASCAHDEARIVVSVRTGQRWTDHAFVVAIPATCPGPARAD